MEAGIRGIFAFGMRHPANDWNSESKFHWQGIRNSVPAESGIHSAESRMQTCLGLTGHCTQIWIVLLTGRAAREICFNQSEALLWSDLWHVISLEFLRLFLRRCFEGNKWWSRVMVSQAKLCPENGHEGNYVVTKSLILFFPCNYVDVWKSRET